MKKICLIISFIICLLCFVGCKNKQEDVYNPDIPDNPNQEQSGEQIPGDENLPVSSGESSENQDVDKSGENTPNLPDEKEDNNSENTNTGSNEDKNDEKDNDIIENPDNTNAISSISDAMTNIVKKAGAEVRMPMQEAITAESSSGFIGLSTEDFNAYVEDSVLYESMISPAYQSICMIKVNDSSKVESLKKSILDNCNPRKWVCTGADKAVVVNSGNYIMLAMSTEDLCDKLVTAFSEEIGGNLGETLSKMAE